MLVTMLKSKIHRATVTSVDLEYEGSISIDPDLMELAGILEYEQVDVLNVNAGTRFTTYTIKAEPGSGQIQVNGAAARLVQPRDLVIIVAYTTMKADEAARHVPKVVLLDKGNEVIQT